MLQRILIEKMDKISTGVGGAALVLMVVMGFRGGRDARFAAISAGIERIEQQARVVDRSVPPKLELPGERAIPARDVDVFRFPAWATHRRPLLLRTVEQPRPALECIHRRPVILTPEAARGAVRLSWREGENRNVEVQRYTLYRAENLDDPSLQPEAFSKLVEVDGGDFEVSYEDTAVGPDTSYSYYVVSHAAPDARALASENYSFDREQREMASATSENVSTPADVLIWLYRVSPDDRGFVEPTRDRIDISVSFWDGETQAYGRPKRFRDLLVGDDPENRPTLVGEGAQRTGWFLRELDGWYPPGNLNEPFRYWVVIEHARSGRTRKLVEGVVPSALQD